MTSKSLFLIRYRWLIIALFLVITVLLGMQLPKAEIDSNMKSMLPNDMPSRVNTDRIEEIFGGTEMLMVLVRTDDVLKSDTLNRVRTISRGMQRIDGVDKVLSLFELKHIRGEDGAMVVDPAVKRIPRTDEQREVLRADLRTNDLVYGNVVSEDFTVTAVIALLTTDVQDELIVVEVREMLDANPGDEEILVGGLPDTRVHVSKDIRTDLRRLLPLGLAIMLVFLYICFRQLRGVVLPFFVVIMSILVAMGLVPLLGWKIQIITVLVPMILIAVANDYGIHMIAKYQEDNVEGHSYSSSELAIRMFHSLGKPILLTGLTTIAGMLCLLGHVIIPARELGILASVGILYALAASLFFIPAVMSLLPTAKPVRHSGTEDKRLPLLERLLISAGGLVSAHPRLIITLAVVSAAAASIGIFSVVIDTDPNSYYPDDDPIPVTARVINTELGGSQNVGIVFSGDIKEPELMAKIDRLEHQIGNLPDVGSTTSIARVLRQMSRALNDPDEPMYNTVPDSRNAIAQYFELYSMSGDPDDFEKLVDFDYTNAMLTARINSTSTARLSQVVDEVGEMVKDDPAVTLIGGFGLILTELAHLVVRGQLLSLALALSIVAGLLMLLFRSPMAGVIGAIPLALSIVLLFGLMGLFGIELNIATAMLSSIMIGVGVDYTIHFLWRYREERRSGREPENAVRKTLTTTGRGIVFNALSVVIGFIVLMSSSFLPVRFFGFLVLVSILACLVGALILVPALCLAFRPRFLEPME